MSEKNAYITELRSKRIKECIEMCGITQAYIAEKLNYTPQHISYVVNGKRPLSKELAIGLADLFSSLLPSESVPVEMPFSELSDDEQAEFIDIDGIDKKEIAEMPYDIKAGLADIDENGFVTVFYDAQRIDYRYLLGEIDNMNVFAAEKGNSVDSRFKAGIRAILHHYGYEIKIAWCPSVTAPPLPDNKVLTRHLKEDNRTNEIINIKTGETYNLSAAELYFLFCDFAETICGIMDRTFCRKQFENTEIQYPEMDSSELPFDGDFFIPPE